MAGTLSAPSAWAKITKPTDFFFFITFDNSGALQIKIHAGP
jgi:hypothetical protein